MNEGNCRGVRPYSEAVRHTEAQGAHKGRPYTLRENDLEKNE